MQVLSYPKLLVISNQCLSQQTSNGRTLRNFLMGWPIESIAQFCTQFVTPDFTTCSNYCCVSDSLALKSIWGKSFNPFPVLINSDRKSSLNTQKKVKRSPLTMLLRDLVWRCNRWKTKAVNDWIASFSPQVILLQAGDSPFMFKIAREWSKKFNAPLVIYNSEGYYFKEFDYFRSKGLPHLLYPIFHNFFCFEFEKTLKCAKKSIYICGALQDDYDVALGLPSETIYTATDCVPRIEENEHEGFVVSYMGNLGVGRHKGLIDIANTLHTLFPSTYLDVYGKIPNDEVKNSFDKCSGIRYKGFVSYADVVKIMHSSDLLVHVESFEEFYKKDSKYAFSTKIADSLVSGVPFLLYAPENFAVSKYLSSNDAAFIAHNKNELEKQIQIALKSADLAKNVVRNALNLVRNNHNAEKNSARFQEILRASVRI